MLHLMLCNRELLLSGSFPLHHGYFGPSALHRGGDNAVNWISWLLWLKNKSEIQIICFSVCSLAETLT